MTWKARPSRAFFLTARYAALSFRKGASRNTWRENSLFPFGPRNRPAVWKVLICGVAGKLHGTSPSASSRVRASLSSAAFAARAANCVYLLADRRRWGCALCIGNRRAPPLVGRARIVGVDGRFRCALPGEGDVFCSAGRHGAQPSSKLRVECGQSRASCSRSGAAIIRRCSQSAGRTHPQTRGEPGHSATSARPHAESHSSIGARRYPPRLNSRSRCPLRHRTSRPRPRPRHRSPKPVQKSDRPILDRRRGRRRRIALRTLVATRPGMIIRGVIILPIIGARAERPRMTSDVAREAAHMRARVPIP